MDFNLSKSLEILQRTPDTLFAILQGISSDWTHNNEGGDTWSVYDIIGHLIHGEKTDWIPRIEIMLSDNKDKTFESFDRFAQFEESKDKTLAALLAEFKSLREKNIKSLQSFHLTKNDFVDLFHLLYLRNFSSTKIISDDNIYYNLLNIQNTIKLKDIVTK